MKKILALLFVLFPTLAFAWTAHVEFDAGAATDRTVVLISEVSGDYGDSYGRISDPGATETDIPNIKPSTQYYAIAYRLDVDNNRSDNSVEYPFLTPDNVYPTVLALPPLMVGGEVLNISITVE